MALRDKGLSTSQIINVTLPKPRSYTVDLYAYVAAERPFMTLTLTYKNPESPFKQESFLINFSHYSHSAWYLSLLELPLPATYFVVPSTTCM